MLKLLKFGERLEVESFENHARPDEAQPMMLPFDLNLETATPQKPLSNQQHVYTYQVFAQPLEIWLQGMDVFNRVLRTLLTLVTGCRPSNAGVSPPPPSRILPQDSS